MPLTLAQLDEIKAANHAKSVAKEAATFLPGDRVRSHGWNVTRTEDGMWRCEKTGTEYTSLSRWMRHKLNRNSFHAEGVYILTPDGRCFPIIFLSPAAERSQWTPWTTGRPYYHLRNRVQQPSLEERMPAVGAAVALIATRLDA